MQATRTFGGWSLALLGMLLAFGFLGSRGIWDPDEGRYTNVALVMLDSGDWLDPMRNEDTGHWTKPPVAYWLVAASMHAFGRNAWAARLPIALCFLACALLAGCTARRLQPGSGAIAAVASLTMLLPVGAAQLVTTDFPLAAAQALAMHAFVEHRFGPRRGRGHALLAMWAAFAIAFMVKGPPALLPLVAVGVFALLVPGACATGLRWHLGGVALFLLLALPWYIAVSLRHAGLLQYFLGAEVVDRVATDRFGRNGQWYGWLVVYLPTLLVGTLPWTRSLWRWARTIASQCRDWRDRNLRAQHARAILLVLWIALPLLVFCIARSRLPLYLLPLFVPIAIAIGMQRAADGAGLPRWPRLAAWAVVLLALRLAAAALPTHKDASAWAEAIRARAPGPVREVVFVEDMARYGLHLHLGAQVEKLSLDAPPQARFNPEYDEPLEQELAESAYETGVVYVAKQAAWPAIRARITRLGHAATVLGAPYEGRVLFTVAPAAVRRASGEPPIRGRARVRSRRWPRGRRRGRVRAFR